MWNGFFDLSDISDITTLKQLYKDALELSEHSCVDILKSIIREKHPTLTAEEYIDKHLNLKTHNVVIDRKAYYPAGDVEGEIGSCTSDSPSIFLFIYLSLDNLYDIVEKYNLPKRL